MCGGECEATDHDDGTKSAQRRPHASVDDKHCQAIYKPVSAACTIASF